MIWISLCTLSCLYSLLWDPETSIGQKNAGRLWILAVGKGQWSGCKPNWFRKSAYWWLLLPCLKLISQYIYIYIIYPTIFWRPKPRAFSKQLQTVPQQEILPPWKLSQMDHCRLPLDYHFLADFPHVPCWQFGVTWLKSRTVERLVLGDRGSLRNLIWS